MHTHVEILHRRWCPDRGPVINIVGWEPIGSNPVINGVARQQPIRPI